MLTSSHRFHNFFHMLDHYATDYFLWVTAGGWENANKRFLQPPGQSNAMDMGMEEGDENPEEGEG